MSLPLRNSKLLIRKTPFFARYFTSPRSISSSIKEDKIYQPVFPSKSNHSNKSNGSSNNKSKSDTTIADLWAKYNNIPNKLRLSIAISVFILALGGNYMSSKIYERLEISDSINKKRAQSSAINNNTDS
ncbi:uncharacterized protein ASCRUDRAFT_75849 [Ascoidea rubescens DSM 1968]|uniref:Uncharacterized protein n=1 Tax=Ascoidea rubescens DSM 1968 TaxID=1344418 RepID=A0A1D2VHM4_9ASCO|nr:hypothetical protein ASCRUDRAFT_75849 [Ascoidea rubescens DSM 1968]ODV61125.1 hypothetical protein ASCRUDRAFT_75849 [Ascoidea rubescens DSM 1968]